MLCGGLSFSSLRLCRALLVTAALFGAAPAQSADREPPSLSSQLADLARRHGVELLYDDALVRGRNVGTPTANLTVEAALRTLLRGTGIGFRKTPDGAYVLFRRSAASPSSQGAEAIPEILVVGRRLQNVDIPRSRDDVQPYKVFDREDIGNAHRDNLDSYFRARLPSNADILAPTQDVTTRPGETGSSIDLRSAGTRRTLVMIDGRRLPSIPNQSLPLMQPDLNGIPLGAVERIEVLTGTAGGIYGPNAVGGLVNVVLQRDYHGAELNLISGISDRGDAARLRIEGRIGLSTDDESTQLMMFAAYSTSERLTYGQRDFALRGRQRAYANAPKEYVLRQNDFRRMPVGNAIAIYSSAPLKLDAELGGATLPDQFTYLPLDFSGTDQQKAEVLLQNSGKVMLDLGPGPGGKDHNLLNEPTVLSGIFSVRHQFGGEGPELFLDALYTRNRGDWNGTSDIEYGLISASAAGNPFTQLVQVRMPSPVLSVSRRTIETLRVAAGIIVPLPSGWKAEADYVFGRSIYTVRNDGLIFDYPGSPYQITLGRGTEGPSGEPPLRPIEDWRAYLEALPAYGLPSLARIKAVNHFGDMSLRLAGPLLRLPGGPSSLSLLAERRREFVPRADYLFNTTEPANAVQRRKLVVISGYGEVQLPLVRQDSPLIPLRKLMVQFAGRYDTVRIEVPANIALANPTSEPLLPLFATRRDSFVFTLGGRISPIPQLTLRASFATGTVPPELDQLWQITRTTVNVFASDPKRGGRRLGSEAPLTTLSGFPPDIGQERGSTLSLGAIITPFGKIGPRLSIDYSRIFIGDRIASFPYSVTALINTLEDRFPERVTRLPLTDADRALGFSGGPISVIDIRAGNFGSQVIKAVDLEFDWPIADVLGGTLTPRASATWLPSVRTMTLQELPTAELVGYRDGPLEWRGNAGFTWAGENTAIDFNMQYYDGYRIAARLGSSSINAFYELFQGSLRIPSQVYFDLAVRRRFPLYGGNLVRSIEVRAGVQNLLDHSPPIIGYPDTTGYSPYGDPRRRRFELGLSVRR